MGPSTVDSQVRTEEGECECECELTVGVIMEVKCHCCIWQTRKLPKFSLILLIGLRLGLGLTSVFESRINKFNTVLGHSCTNTLHLSLFIKTKISCQKATATIRALSTSGPSLSISDLLLPTPPPRRESRSRPSLRLKSKSKSESESESKSVDYI